MGLELAIAFALAFTFTNGFHDAANAVATLIGTRTAQPGPAIAMSAVFNMLGALVLGTAVANTIASIVEVEPSETVAVIGAAAFAGVAWNLLTWWRGLPSSSGHALVGGLVGAALAAGGSEAVRLGGMDGLEPVGLLGTVIALAVSPILGLVAALLLLRAIEGLLRRAARRIERPVKHGQWGMSAALSLSHGANDAQKMMGVIAVMLVATGHYEGSSVPIWVKLASGAALTAGTAIGGWRIVRTVGRGIFRLTPVDGLASQSASTGVILGASLLGGPVSTTQVVASSVIGVGGGRRRWHHVRWAVVRSMGFAWLLTIPCTAALGAVTLLVWNGIA